jgi:hypothetical protein
LVFRTDLEIIGKLKSLAPAGIRRPEVAARNQVTQTTVILRSVVCTVLCCVVSCCVVSCCVVLSKCKHGVVRTENEKKCLSNSNAANKRVTMTRSEHCNLQATSKVLVYPTLPNFRKKTFFFLEDFHASPFSDWCVEQWSNKIGRGKLK